MLSHGGSRLNASKPEANPKTSCPIQKKKTEILLFLFGLFVVYTKLLNWDSGIFACFLVNSCDNALFQKIPCLSLRASNFLMNLNHVSPVFVMITETFSHLWQKKTLQIESPLKRTRPSGCLDGAKYMKNSRDFFVFLHWKSSILYVWICYRDLWQFQTTKDSCLPDEFGVCVFSLEEQ